MRSIIYRFLTSKIYRLTLCGFPWRMASFLEQQCPFHALRFFAALFCRNLPISEKAVMSSFTFNTWRCVYNDSSILAAKKVTFKDNLRYISQKTLPRTYVRQISTLLYQNYNYVVASNENHERIYSCVKLWWTIILVLYHSFKRNELLTEHKGALNRDTILIIETLQSKRRKADTATHTRSQPTYLHYFVKDGMRFNTHAPIDVNSKLGGSSAQANLEAHVRANAWKKALRDMWRERRVYPDISGIITIQSNSIACVNMDYLMLVG